MYKDPVELLWRSTLTVFNHTKSSRKVMSKLVNSLRSAATILQQKQKTAEKARWWKKEQFDNGR